MKTCTNEKKVGIPRKSAYFYISLKFLCPVMIALIISFRSVLIGCLSVVLSQYLGRI